MIELTVSEKDQEAFVKNLRQETAENHQILEDNALSKTLLHPDVSIENYQSYLAALYGMTASCEQQVFPLLGEHIPDLQQRYRSEMIRADLAATGYPAERIAALPVYQFEVENLPQAMGIMYVLEGSTLGGRIIYKHIHAKLGLTETAGGAYFWGYGAQTGVLWKSFISALSRYAVESASESTIIDSAKKTFIVINNWLSDSNDRSNEY